MQRARRGGTSPTRKPPPQPPPALEESFRGDGATILRARAHQGCRSSPFPFVPIDLTRFFFIRGVKLFFTERNIFAD